MIYWLSGGPSRLCCVCVLICFTVGEATSSWVTPRYPSYLAKLAYCQKSGEVILGAAPFFFLSDLQTLLISLSVTDSKSVSSMLMTRRATRPVQQQNLAFSAGAQQKWFISYLNAFFDWMVINMCRYTCRPSGASWGAEEWDYLIIMTAYIMNGDRWLVLTLDPAGNYWTRTKSLIMNLLKPVGLLSWLQLRHI